MELPEEPEGFSPEDSLDKEVAALAAFGEFASLNFPS